MSSIEEQHISAGLAGRRPCPSAFPVLLQAFGGAWTRAVAWELDRSGCAWRCRG